MKGFKTSTDYELLFKLIHEGHRCPAWIIYSDKYDEPIWDLVEVKLQYESDRYSIGTRGIGYEYFKKDLESFKKNCEVYSLKFVLPTE